MDKIKLGLSTVFGFLTGIFGALTVPIIIMVSCNAIDYITGIMAAPKRGKEISSKIGWKGIKKKIGMWLLVIVGVLLDVIISYASENVGFKLPGHLIIGCFVCIWIICNEMLSILENLKDMIPLPAFMSKIIKYIKSQTEQSADIAKNLKDEEEKK